MSQRDTTTTEAVCPFLGLRYDRDTRYGFPNEGNHCHRERSPRSINLDYQEGVCLTDGYLNCPIYLHSGGNVPVGNARPTVRVIPRDGSPPAETANRSAATAPPPSRKDGTAWTMLDEVDGEPAAQDSRNLFSYGWFRLFFGLLLVVGSLSGMLLLMQGTDLGGLGPDAGIETATPAGGVLPIVETATPETPTATLPPSPSGTLLPSATLPATGTPTQTPTVTPSASPTGTPSLTPTNTSPPFIFPTNTPLPTWTPTPTLTPVPTNTPVPPTNTPVPPTNTPVPPTNTPVPPTNTPISDVPTPTP